LAHDFLITLGRPDEQSISVVQIWSLSNPFRCIWRLDDHPEPIWGIAAKLPTGPLQVECNNDEEANDCSQPVHGNHSDSADVAASQTSPEQAAQDEEANGCFQHVYGNNSNSEDEPAAQINPEQAAIITRSLWETAIPRLHESGAVPSASGSQSEQQENTIVLLSFSRRPAELKQVVLESALAIGLRARGVDVQPVWAGGAIVLADALAPERLGDDLGTWNIAVGESDEHLVMDALQTLPYNIRPRLKSGNGRRHVPGHTEFFRMSDAESGAEHSLQHGAEGCSSLCSSDGDSSDVQSSTGSQGIEICVFRTFLHARPVSSARSLPRSI